MLLNIATVDCVAGATLAYLVFSCLSQQDAGGGIAPTPCHNPAGTGIRKPAEPKWPRVVPQYHMHWLGSIPWTDVSETGNP
jgi:hypothetical protein